MLWLKPRARDRLLGLISAALTILFVSSPKMLFAIWPDDWHPRLDVYFALFCAALITGIVGLIADKRKGLAGFSTFVVFVTGFSFGSLPIRGR
jgi:hypothetical protein